MPPKDSREVQHIVDELIDDRERRGQGRRSIFPNRLSTARLRLPRQAVTAKWRHDAGVLGSLPFAQWGLWAPAPFRTDAVHAGLRVFWQLGSVLFGMPAREL